MARKNEIIKVNEVHLQSIEEIENLIIEVRGKQTMLDRDIAQLYGVDTKRLNEQVRRNIERFPERFRFQLTDNETTKLVANCDRLRALKHSSVNPYVFTEQGVAMLSAVLRSDTAVSVSIQIMDAFTAMRHFLASNAPVLRRLDIIERNHLRNVNGLRTLIRILASGIGTPTNPKRIANTFQSTENVPIKDCTIRDYIGYLQDAFLIEEALRYDVKGL